MENIVYRVYNDSSHYIGTKYIQKSYTKDKTILKNYESEFVKEHGKNRFKRGSSKIREKLDIKLEIYYKQSLNVRKKERFDFIKEKLINDNIEFVDKDITNYLAKQERLLYDRIDRFRKKALNNEWNYFVTITYDDKKHTEQTFKEKLKKCLANLHTRNGYKYMGVFERSETGRLHFHALFYIPKGAMRGEIKEIKDYSISDKKMRVACINTFFEKRFGRNDFIEINSKELMRDNTINYLLKYIAKSDERIFYSRGIKTYHFIKITTEEIITDFGEFVKKYVLFDDVLENAENFVPMRC